MDGAAHHHRKNIFMDLMTPERMEDYHRILDKNLTQALEAHGQFELFDLSKMVSLHLFASGQVSIYQRFLKMRSKN